MPRPSDDDLPDLIGAQAAPLATELGLEVLELMVRGQRGSRMVRLVVDADDPDPEVQVGIDDIAALSRDLEAALDDGDLIAGGYTLEVTSPGADRALTRPRDFARNRGRRLRVQLHDTAADPAEVVGDLTDATATTLTLTTHDGVREVALGDVREAHVVLPW